MTQKIFLRNVFSSYLSMGVASVAGLVLTTLLYDFLHARDFAILSFAIAATGMLAAIDFGIASSLVRFVSILARQNQYRELQELFSTVFFLMAGAGIAAAMVILVSTSWMVHYFSSLTIARHEAAVAIVLVGCSLVFEFPCVALSAYITGCQDFHLLNGVDVGAQFLRLGAIIGFLIEGFGLTWVAAVFPLIAFSRFLGLLWACRHGVNPSRPRLSDVRINRVMEIGRFTLLAFLEDTTMKYYLLMDTFIAARLLPIADLAVLTVARRIPLALSRVAQQPHGAAYPIISAAAAEGDNLFVQKFVLVSTRATLALGLPIAVGLFLWARTILLVWVGPQVLSGTTVFRLMAFVGILVALMETPLNHLYGAGQIRFSAGLTVTMLVVYTVLGSLACSRFGLNGLAATYVGICSVGASLLFFQSLKLCKVSSYDWLRRGAFPALVIAAPTIIVLLGSYEVLPHSLYGLIASVSLSVAVILGTLVRLGRHGEHASWKDRIWNALSEVR